MSKSFIPDLFLTQTLITVKNHPHFCRNISDLFIKIIRCLKVVRLFMNRYRSLR